jgi:hypothetical protein
MMRRSLAKNAAWHKDDDPEEDHPPSFEAVAGIDGRGHGSPAGLPSSDSDQRAILVN